MHPSTLLPTLLLLTLSPLTLANPLPPQTTDGPHRRASPADAPAPEFAHPHAKQLSDLAATLSDLAARLAVPPPDILANTEHQPGSFDDDDDDDDDDDEDALGVANLDGIDGASFLPANALAPRDPSPTTSGNQQTDPPRVKARRDPSPTDKQPGNRQTDPPHHRLLAARHGGQGEGEGEGEGDGEGEGENGLGDALPAPESDDEGEGYYDEEEEEEEEAIDPFTELSGAVDDDDAPLNPGEDCGEDDAPMYAAPNNKRQSGHHHGDTNHLDTTTGLGFPSTGGLTDGLGGGLGNADGLREVVSGLGGAAAAAAGRRKRRGVGWAA